VRHTICSDRINYSNFAFAPLPFQQLKIASQPRLKPNCSRAGAQTDAQTIPCCLVYFGHVPRLYILSQFDPAKYRTSNGWPHNNAENLLIYLFIMMPGQQTPQQSCASARHKDFCNFAKIVWTM